MKNQIIKFVFAGFLLFSNTFYSQTNSWQCGVRDPSGSSPNIPYIGTQNVNLVVVYLDFPDGRIGGTIVPTTEQELTQVADFWNSAGLRLDSGVPGMSQIGFLPLLSS